MKSAVARPGRTAGIDAPYTKTLKVSPLMTSKTHLFLQLLTDVLGIQLDKGIVRIKKSNQSDAHLRHPHKKHTILNNLLGRRVHQ